MTTGNDGMGGVKISHIALEETKMIGMQNPNTRPSTRESKDREKLPTLKITSSGAKIDDVPVYDCEPIDNSWLSYGGKYTLGVGNKWHIRVGSGGIYTETTGPIQIDGEIAIHNMKKGMFVQTKLFQVISQERTMMSGKRIDFDFDEYYFNGNVSFINNVAINGGLYVNGELICNHMTTQKQEGLTSFSESTEGFINPNMSFHIFQGQSAAAIKYTQKSLLGTTFSGMDVHDADEKIDWIEAELAFNTDFLEQLLPGLNDVGISLIKMLLCLPIKLKFPKGISLISDATDTDNPTIYPKMQFMPRVPGMAATKADFFGPGHQHSFSGPACNYVNDTKSVYSEGTKVLQDTPLKHKQAVVNGAEDFDEAIKQGKQVAQDYIKDYSNKLLSDIMGFSF